MSPTLTSRITPCLWLESQAEEAARFYTSIFKNSKISRIVRYGKERHPAEGIEEGMAMTVTFELDGQEFVALNGGPQFKFNEAISMIVNCDSQEEIDYYWARLSEGGDGRAQVCGWLKDQYGLSWQIVPVQLSDMLRDPDTSKSERVTRAMLQMKKLDLPKLQQVNEGNETYDLSVSRVLEAPVQEVWNAWTNSELVRQWWGPTGFTCPVAEMDVRVGGNSLVCMQAPESFGGHKIYNTWTYTNIVPLDKMEYILRFTDQQGTPLVPQQIGLPAGIPMEVPHVVILKRLEGDRTELIIEEYGYTTEQARDMSKLGLEPCLDKMAAIFRVAELG